MNELEIKKALIELFNAVPKSIAYPYSRYTIIESDICLSLFLSRDEQSIEVCDDRQQLTGDIQVTFSNIFDLEGIDKLVKEIDIRIKKSIAFAAKVDASKTIE